MIKIIPKNTYKDSFLTQKDLEEIKKGISELTEENNSFHIKIREYKNIEPIPYSVLEEALRNLISNWNQKQKEK